MNKKTVSSLLFLCFVGFFSPQGKAQVNRILWPAQPILDSRDCILQLITPQLRIKTEAVEKLEKPTIQPEGHATLEQYQASFKSFQGWTPDQFLNFYNPISNEIFLNGDTNYYKKLNRSIFDSLAHELTHFLQVKHWQADTTGGDDFLELQAVQIQTWFRETHGHNVNNDGTFTCPLN